MSNKWIRKGATLVVLSLIYLGLSGVALADGGFAISGSFNAQQFELPQGGTLNAVSVYIVVFNQGTEDIHVRLTPQTPPGVKLVLALNDFELKAGTYQQVQVGIQVSADTAPGDYEIGLLAEPYRKDVTGIQIIGAAAQQTRLRVTGDSAQVTVQMVSPEGDPVTGDLRLFMLLEGKPYEIATSATGVISTTVAPGNYRAVAYVGGEQLAQEDFSVAANEQKMVSLSVRTIYFEAFSVVPAYRKDNGQLAFAQVVYTLKNLYKAVPEARVLLQVSLNGTLLDEVTLATLSPLEIGRVGLNYAYIPQAGWQQGSYQFQLVLQIDGKPYAASTVQPLEVSGSAVGAAIRMRFDPVYLLSGGAALLIIGGLVYLLVSRRRRKKAKQRAS